MPQIKHSSRSFDDVQKTFTKRFTKTYFAERLAAVVYVYYHYYYYYIMIIIIIIIIAVVVVSIIIISIIIIVVIIIIINICAGVNAPKKEINRTTKCQFIILLLFSLLFFLFFFLTCHFWGSPSQRFTEQWKYKKSIINRCYIKHL